MSERADLLTHPSLEALARALAARPGRPAETDGEPARASVALVLRAAPEGGVELLLIKRSERDGDPWSGHIALPGGRRDPVDRTLEDTAVRETLEETSIDLRRDGLILGMLDELRPRTPSLPQIIVSPFVSVVRPDVAITISDELQDAFWVSLDLLRDPATQVESSVTARGITWRVPSWRLGTHVVWGMTERILRELLALLH